MTDRLIFFQHCSNSNELDESKICHLGQVMVKIIAAKQIFWLIYTGRRIPDTGQLSQFSIGLNQRVVLRMPHRHAAPLNQIDSGYTRRGFTGSE